MEEIDQKINSNNVFLQSQGVTILFNKIIEDSKNGINSYEGIQANAGLTSTWATAGLTIAKTFETLELNLSMSSAEVKKLWQLANTGEATAAILATEIIVSLVSYNVIPGPAALQNFLSDISCAKFPAAHVGGIAKLFILLTEMENDVESCEKEILQPFFTGPPKGPVHPFVILLTRKLDLSNAILGEIENLFYFPSSKIQKAALDLIHPVVIHTFCLSESAHLITECLLMLLIDAHKNGMNNDVVSLLCNVVSFIKCDTKSHVERRLMILVALSELSLYDKNKLLQNALLPCLVFLIPSVLKYSLSTLTIERYIVCLAAGLGHGCDVTLCALADAIPAVAGNLQVNLLRLGLTLLSYKDGTPLVAARLLPSLLQILSSPCSAVSGLATIASAVVSLIQNIPLQTSSNVELGGNEFWEQVQCMHPKLSSYVPAVEFCCQIVKDDEKAKTWLCKLADNAKRISGFHYAIVTSVFLHQHSSVISVQEAAKVLEREVVKCQELAFEVFPMVLYRLGREKHPKVHLTLLYLLPSLAVNKMCVALVLKTLLAFWASNSLKPLVLKLLYELWIVEPRVFPYLAKLIDDKSFNSRDLQISRAFVVSSICKVKPQHGEELLPVLSAFLNECKGEDGIAQTVIALDGIYELCSAAIIDLRTTWKVIAPKLMKDKRTEVISKLCHLLSLAPKFDIRSQEYEEFTNNSLSYLWSCIISNSKPIILKAAYKALEGFNFECYKLKMLPKYMKEGHKLPAQFRATPMDAARNPEDVLPYVPGLAWVKQVLLCPLDHINYVQSFSKSLVMRELASLPKGIYLTAVQEAKRTGHIGSGGQSEPTSYSFFKETSILKAFVQFLLSFTEELSCYSDIKNGERMILGAKVILSALGQPLNRPYPALDWIFLENITLIVDSWNDIGNLASEIKQEIFKIASQQSNKSSSAAELISKWLKPPLLSNLSLDSELCLFNLIEHIGRGVSANVFSLFVNHVINKYSETKESLKLILSAIKPHLTSSVIHENNRNILSNAIENLNVSLDVDDNDLYEVYKACVADLPVKHIDRLTSPSLWWEITDDKLFKAAILRCHVASNDPGEKALPWLNDLVDSAASLPGERNHLLLVMSETLVHRSVNIKESTEWFLQLIGRLNEHIQNKKSKDDTILTHHEYNQKVKFYVDLMVTSLLIWSGLWAINDLEHITSDLELRHSLIPSALITLYEQPEWDEVLRQLLNWLLLTWKDMVPPLKFSHLYRLILFLGLLDEKVNQKVWNKMMSCI